MPAEEGRCIAEVERRPFVPSRVDGQPDRRVRSQHVRFEGHEVADRRGCGDRRTQLHVVDGDDFRRFDGRDTSGGPQTLTVVAEQIEQAISPGTPYTMSPMTSPGRSGPCGER